MKRILLLFLLILPVITYSQDISNIKLKDVSGKKFLMKDHLKNDATIVLFWATWCIPCKKEFPAVQALLKKYSDKNIRVIAISQDSPRSLSKVKSFVRTHKYDFIYLLDYNRETSTKLLVNSVPYTMLVDSTGKVQYTHRGYRKGDEMELEKEMLKLWNKNEK